jgi:phosphoribosylglycinamide formyltransferase 1
MTKIRIAVLASGSGSNAQNIADYFKEKQIEVTCILSNNPEAYVLQRAKKLGIESVVFTKEQFKETDFVVDYLTQKNIDLVVLAGFLWLVPTNLIEAFPNKIVNIHPALLPKFGGKGMYGDKVHKAVVAAKERESGITIHFVNQHYDQGAIIAQYKTQISEKDDYLAVAQKIHELEYEFFPKEIENIALDLRSKKI